MSKFTHLDAAQQIFLARQLESIDQTNYSELIPGALGRRYIPLVSNVAAWANVYTYSMWKKVGRAKVVSRNADDLPRVQLTRTEASRSIKEIGNSYGWSVGEIQRAAGTNTPLATEMVMAAQAATEREIDDLLAVGSSAHNIEGLLNLSDVTDTSPTTGSWTAATDGDLMIGDLNKLVLDIVNGLKQTDAPGFNRFVILLPVDKYGLLATTRLDSTETTALQFLLRTSPWIDAVEPWYQCSGVGAGSTDRAVAFPRNPVALGALIPKEFGNATAPQERGLDVIVPTLASCGGVVARYPVAIRYMDGI
jgi:hypothetical protein